MNIQIWGNTKNFDSKKAERWFKERRIKYQYIDIVKYGISLGELKSVVRAIGLNNILDTEKVDCAPLLYLATEEAKLEKLFDNQIMLKMPIVRNGKQATAGYQPEIWASWS